MAASSTLICILRRRLRRSAGSAGRTIPRPALYLEFLLYGEVVCIRGHCARASESFLRVDFGGDRQSSYRSLAANLASDTAVRGGAELGAGPEAALRGRNKFTASRTRTTTGRRLLFLTSPSNGPSPGFCSPNYCFHGQNPQWTFQYLRALPQNGFRSGCPVPR
jgi:hypothetical protein